MTTDSVRFFRKYRFAPPGAPEWLHAAVGSMEPHVGGAHYFKGEYALRSVPDCEFDRSRPDAWLADVAGHWPDIQKLRAHFSGDSVTVSLACDFARQEAELSVTAPGAEEALRVADALKAELGLDDATPDRGAPEEQESRRYWTRGRIDRPWMEDAVAQVLAVTGEPFYFDGRVQLRPGGGRGRGQGELTRWKELVLERWEDAVSVYCWIAGPGGRVVLDCDLRRELLTLEVRTHTRDHVVAAFHRIEQELRLDPVEGSPYEYRRFGQVFEIIEWEASSKNSAFAKAVKEAVDKAFDPPPVVVSAYVTTGKKVEDLESFPDLPAFLERVGGGVEYGTARLYLEGVRGRSLGIMLDRGQMTLDLRSSLEMKAFIEVATTFENTIGLKPVVRADPAPAGKAPAAWVGRVLRQGRAPGRRRRPRGAHLRRAHQGSHSEIRSRDPPPPGPRGPAEPAPRARGARGLGGAPPAVGGHPRRARGRAPGAHPGVRRRGGGHCPGA